MRMVSVPGLLPVILCILILAPASPLTAQITFQRTYGGASGDYGYSVAQTTDGGYVIVGHTESYGAGHDDFYLVKTDACGDTTWTRAYGSRHWDYGYSVAQTADSGYVIAGVTNSLSVGGDVRLIKTNVSGDILWTRTYGGRSGDAGYSVAQTTDGGYIITGHTRSFGPGWCSLWLIKTDASGDTIWTRTYGHTEEDHGYSVAQTTDSGYIVTGWTNSYGGLFDAWLIKTDASGNVMWIRTFGGENYDRAWSVAQTTDGGYVVAGETRSFGAGNYDAWLIKTDASGDTMWTRTYGDTASDYGKSVAQTADGGYIIAGYTESFGAGGYDFWLIKTDSAGDTLWTRTFGGESWDYGNSVAQTADGGYVIAGSSRSFGAGWYDVWLIKTDANGNIAIAEPQPPVAHKPVGATIVRGVLLCPVWSATTPSLRNVSDIALHNAVGRKVMDLRPGPNDIRHVSPGVYFVRETSSVERKASNVRKVVITH